MSYERIIESPNMNMNFVHYNTLGQVNRITNVQQQQQQKENFVNPTIGTGLSMYGYDSLPSPFHTLNNEKHFPISVAYGTAKYL